MVASLVLRYSLGAYHKSGRETYALSGQVSRSSQNNLFFLPHIFKTFHNLFILSLCCLAKNFVFLMLDGADSWT